MPKKYLLLLLFLIPFCFHTQFDKIWNEYIVAKILTHFEQSIFNDLFIIASFGVIMAIFLRKWAERYLFSPFTLSILGCTFLCYFLYLVNFSFFHNDFKFKHLIIFPFFRYCDFLMAFPFICSVFLLGFRYVLMKIKYLYPYNREKGGFIPDLPVSEQNLKEISEKTTANDFAKKLASKLLKTNSENVAFAVGIVGEWGTGKTSLMKLLHNNLAQADKDIILIDFNPWNSTSPQSIITDFFDTFQEKMGEYSAEIDSSIQNYVQKLANAEGEDIVSKALKLAVDFLGESKNLAQEHEAINDILRRIDRQTFIFIDDLDRLDKNEVLEVIRLIRNSANFHNVFFIVAYDKAYIEQAIELLNPHNKSFFLEKIFQLEVHIPAYEYHHIAEDLYNKLVEAIPFLKGREKHKDFILKHRGIYNIIQNFRDVKRFVNSFSLVYNEKLAWETYFPDLFYVELLRFKYSLIYDMLKKKPTDFLQESMYKKEYTLSKDIQVVINSIYPTQYKNIENILSLLFNDSSYLGSYGSVNRDKQLGIRNIYNFYTYFAFRTFDDNIGVEEFRSARKDIDKFKKSIDTWNSKQMIPQFIHRCNKTADLTSDKERKILIKSIFYFGQINDDKRLYEMIDINRLFKFENTEDAKTFAYEIFYNAEYPCKFESNLLFNDMMYEEMEALGFNSDEINAIFLNYLQKIAEQANKVGRKNNSLLIRAFERAERLKKIGVLDGNYNPDVTFQRNGFPQQAKEIIINFARIKDIKGLLEACIKVESDDNEEVRRYMIDKIFIERIFDSLKNFETFLDSFTNDMQHIESKVVNEFLGFYKKSQENNFQILIEYQFKSLIVY